jgi:membrane protein implicated in regulation of membrane protease activity
MFTMLGHSEGPEPFSLQDLVGQTARVSVGIRAGHFGTVQLSYAGQSHELTATSDVDIAAGSVVKVESVAGSNLVVAPASTARSGGEDK